MKKPRDSKTIQNIQHPLFGISLGNWIRIVEKNQGIDTRYFGKALFITCSSLFFSPARLLCTLKYHSKINNQTIQHPPVFIIGHWRSGTTLLHELLSNDPQFCHVSLWNTLLPDSFLVLEPWKAFLSDFLPLERPMDAIEVTMDGPYEDEAALAVLTPWSFFHCFHFPKNAEEHFEKAVLFKDLPPNEKNHWKKNYLYFIKTVIFAHQGKRFLSKNPPNTARLTTLLELFPDAKIILIYRNPYTVFLSTKNMRKRVLEKLALQQASEPEIDNQVINQYTKLMTQYFEYKNKIPKKNLIEIQYEDLIANPIQQIKKIYKQLQLSGLQQAIPEMEKYLKKQKNYQTNTYTMDKKIIKEVHTHWKFTIKKWGYTQPKKQRK